MTSTGTYQGLVDGKKSSKVLKPPGGGSSDIFGATGEETSPRRVKSNQQSQLGSAFFGNNASNGASNGSNGSETPRGVTKPGNDSYKRLFGPPDALPTQNLKNHMKSNILMSGESTTIVSPSKSTCSSNGSIPNGSISNDALHNNDNTDGNPVTGAGYGSDQQNNVVQNGSGNSNASGSDKSNDSSPGSGNMSNRVQRNRVPPGGYSSGLW